MPFKRLLKNLMGGLQEMLSVIAMISQSCQQFMLHGGRLVRVLIQLVEILKVIL